MRPLIWIPIVHSPEDLGGLRESVHDTYVLRRGQAEWDAYVKNVDKLWKAIRLMVDGLSLDWPRVRLYQDGLPVCDHEEPIVRELAQKGSDNHRLLVDLIDRGAQLTGTESPELLIEEYDFNRRILSAEETSRPATTRSPGIQRQARQLLDKRDKFIAARIAETLQSHQQGLIFLGMLHSLEGRLPRDIKLTITRP
jgi:hypothetical protein